MNTTEQSVELIATAAFGVEATVKWELSRLGYQAKGTTAGRLAFTADPKAIVRTNLYLRAADRVLLVMGRFDAVDFDELYAGIMSLDWKGRIPEGAKLTVRVGVVRSPITSARSSQSIVKRAIVDALAGKGGTLEETGNELVIDVSILGNKVTVSLDTSGQGLHKRGYRQRSQAGQLKETLAAALVMICRWQRDTPFIDPFCGSGTIPIEAALFASNCAPGLHRDFAAEDWPLIDQAIWEQERALAAEAVNDEGIAPILASDINPQAIGLARRCAEAAGVAHLTTFDLCDYRDLNSQYEYGQIITNPPYGVRVGEEQEAKRIHQDLPAALARLKSWSHAFLLAGEDFEPMIRQSATKRRKLYNAKIQCTLYQYSPADDGSPAFASRTNTKALEDFHSGITNRVRHFRKWQDKQDIHAYRLYEGHAAGLDITVDRFGDKLRVVDRGYSSRTDSADRINTLTDLAKTAASVLEIPEADAHCIQARARVQRAEEPVIVGERGLLFEVRPGDLQDPGLDLSLRELRAWVARRAAGAAVLDLAAKPGVLGEAAMMVCESLTAWSPDEHAFARFKSNLKVNRIDPNIVIHETGDPITAVDAMPEDARFDLVLCVLDDFAADQIRPAFGDLMDSCLDLLSPGGSVVMAIPAHDVPESNNLFEGRDAKELTGSVQPEDFKRDPVLRIWICRNAVD